MMKVWTRQPSVRRSLTLWNVSAMLVVLGVYAAVVFTFVYRSVSATLDNRLRNDLQWAAEMWQQRPDGSLTWFEDVSEAEESPWLQVWNRAGDILFQTAFAKRQPLPESDRLAFDADNRVVGIDSGGMHFRMLSRRSNIGGRPVVLQVARSEREMRGELRDLMLILVLGLPVAVAAAGFGGYLLARIALAPVNHMAERARSITAQRLGDRLPVANPDDELGRLASVFNDLLGRLEASFHQMRQFTADVSHELRTPLAALRSVGEVTLRSHGDVRASRETIGSMLEEVDRLTTLVERLLLMSRAEYAKPTLVAEVVDLSAMAEEVTRQLGVLAEEKGQEIAIEQIGHPCCLGDRVLLRQALTNLLDNAIKHTPNGTRIRVRAEASSRGAILEVSDNGPGVPSERRSRIFERFSKGSPGSASSSASTWERGGAGLGLAIAKWAVEANQGRLSLTEPTAGSTFRMTFPALADEQPV